MARASLNPLANWCAVLRAQDAPLSFRKVRERLSVLPSVDWSSGEGRTLLGHLAHLLNRRPPSLGVQLKILDELDVVGASQEIWAVEFPSGNSYLGHPTTTTLLPGMLRSIPPAHRPAAMLDRWRRHLVQGVRSLPESDPLLTQVLNVLTARGLGVLVEEGHCVVAEAVVQRWPQVWVTEGPDQRMWLHGATPASAWSWALERGMDPMTIMPGSPLPKPIWRRAAEQGFAPAVQWGQTHDPLGWDNHCSWKVFQVFEIQRFHRERNHFVDLLLAHGQGGRLGDERGRSILWHACHHALSLIDDLGLDSRLRYPGWQTATDEEGRNLASAVLTSPDTNTANQARRQGLRWLHQEGVPLDLDRAGRGVLISQPTLVSLFELPEIAATYPWPDRWWSGNDTQVAAAIQCWAEAPLSSQATCAKVMDQVPSSHPYLRGLHAALRVARGNSANLDPSARLPPTFSLDSTLGRQLMSRGAHPEVVALLRHGQAPDLAERPARPRRRS